MTQAPFNHNTLPYNINYKNREGYKPVRPELHKLLCDLTLKYPSLTFLATSTSRVDSDDYADDIYVYSGTERLANVWMTTGYDRASKQYIPNYIISSERITSGRRGSRHSKTSKHYKVILKEAMLACVPLGQAVVIDKFMELAGSKLETLTNRAGTGVSHVIERNAQHIATFLLAAHNNRELRVPDALLNMLASGWQDKVHSAKAIKTMLDLFRAKEGMAVKLLEDGSYMAVDCSTNFMIESSSPYDLPSEYQTKLAMLKLVDFDQPVVDIGVKIKFADSVSPTTMFYMTPGEVKTTC